MTLALKDALRFEVERQQSTSFYDYDRQVWIVQGRVQRCGHPESMECQCVGRLHAGETYEQLCAEVSK